MKFTVTIDRDETGVWVAECPSIPGCVWACLEKMDTNSGGFDV